MDWCTSMGKLPKPWFTLVFNHFFAWEFEDFADSRDDFEWLKIGRKEIYIYITQTPLLRSWWNSISTTIIHKGCGEVEASWIAHQVVCFVYPEGLCPTKNCLIVAMRNAGRRERVPGVLPGMSCQTKHPWDLGPQFYSNGSKSVRTLCLVTKNYTDYQHSYKPAGWFMSTKENRDPPVLPVAVSFQWFRLFWKTSGKTWFSLWKSTSLELNPPFWCNPKLPQAHPDTLDPHVAETLGFPRRTQHPLPPPRQRGIAPPPKPMIGMLGFTPPPKKHGENKWNVTNRGQKRS